MEGMQSLLKIQQSLNDILYTKIIVAKDQLQY